MSMTLIQSQVLSASAASVTFSGIPQTFKTLKLVISARGDSTFPGLAVNPNGNTANLTQKYIFGNGSTAVSGTQADAIIGNFNGTNTTANVFTNIEVDFPGYASPNAKPFSVDNVQESNDTTGGRQMMFAILWSSTAAITSLSVVPDSGNFVAGSSFYLYGIN